MTDTPVKQSFWDKPAATPITAIISVFFTLIVSSVIQYDLSYKAQKNQVMFNNLAISHEYYASNMSLGQVLLTATITMNENNFVQPEALANLAKFTQEHFKLLNMVANIFPKSATVKEINKLTYELISCLESLQSNLVELSVAPAVSILDEKGNNIHPDQYKLELLKGYLKNHKRIDRQLKEAADKFSSEYHLFFKDYL